MLRRIASGSLFVVALLSVVLVAGCGGDDGDSATVQWADGVCSAVTTWRDDVASTADSLTAGNLGEGSIRDAFDEFEEATGDLVDDLRGLGAPETDAGEQAKESIDALLTEVEETVAQMRGSLDSGAGLLPAVGQMSSAFTMLRQQVSTTVTELRQIDTDGELEQAFRDADSCDDLTAD